MKSQAALLGVRQAVRSPESDLWRHAAVRPLADHEAPLAEHQVPRVDGRDFSRVPVHAAGLEGRHAEASCPLARRRCPFGGACHTCSARVQAKLVTNQPGDEYEREADRVADRLTGASAMQLQGRATSQVEPTQVPPIVDEVLHSPGQPLDAVTRAFMEPRFGYDFGQVQVHADTRAAESTRAVNAEAYTVGSQVVFGHGMPAVNTLRGRYLLAHELAHVVQQSGCTGAVPFHVQRSPDAPPSFWFQDPAIQRRGVGESGQPTTSEQRARVYIQPELGQVAVPGMGDVFVRFAYSETEVSLAGASPRIERAKNSILRAIGQVMQDIYALPPAASRAERREQETVRARLRETLRGLSRSSPLNVYIAAEPSPQELLTGQIAALTDRVFVNLQDVGDPARLEAAIRMPLLMLRGGGIPTRGGVRPVPAAAPADLQRTLLHEALHALLIRQSSDANAIWEASRAQLTVRGSPNTSPRFVELVRKYLIAQEEVFAYENEANLYPPVSPEKASYDSFITNVQLFLRRRQLTLNTVRRSIPVSQRVARQAVTWIISYQVPSGTVDLTVDDIRIIDLLLAAYRLR